MFPTRFQRRFSTMGNGAKFGERDGERAGFATLSQQGVDAGGIEDKGTPSTSSGRQGKVAPGAAPDRGGGGPNAGAGLRGGPDARAATALDGQDGDEQRPPLTNGK